MKKIAALLLTLVITGCATTKTYQASPQFYRAKGQDNQVQITGKIDQDYNFKITGDTYSNKVTIFFDGKPQIEGHLDRSQTGELTGQPYNDKPTSASCSAKVVSKDWVELKCIVFVDNERAATLTM
jgi:hypothetical protein